MHKACRLKLGILPLLKMQMQHASEDVKLATENLYVMACTAVSQPAVRKGS